MHVQARDNQKLYNCEIGWEWDQIVKSTFVTDLIMRRSELRIPYAHTLEVRICRGKQQLRRRLKTRHRQSPVTTWFDKTPRKQHFRHDIYWLWHNIHILCMLLRHIFSNWCINMVTMVDKWHFSQLTMLRKKLAYAWRCSGDVLQSRAGSAAVGAGATTHVHIEQNKAIHTMIW